MPLNPKSKSTTYCAWIWHATHQPSRATCSSIETQVIPLMLDVFLVGIVTSQVTDMENRASLVLNFWVQSKFFLECIECRLLWVLPTFWGVGSIIFISTTCGRLVSPYLLGLIDNKINQSFNYSIGYGKVLNSLFVEIDFHLRFQPL